MKLLPLISQGCKYLTMTASSSSNLSCKSRNLLSANLYCASSNLHDVGGIRKVISPDRAVVYGLTGLDNIMNGIEDFHQRYADVFWIFHNVVEEKDNSSVLIEFDRYWTVEAEDGQRSSIYRCSASEVMTFDESGRINSIAYRVVPNDPVLFGPEYPPDRSSILLVKRMFVTDNPIDYGGE